MQRVLKVDREGDMEMRKAFTLLELVFVIVVIGILAAVIIPNTRTNPAREAAVDLVSKIRYTQHLAMVDDKFDVADATWMRNRWQIVFTDANTKYSITHFNYNNGVLGAQTYAQDPLNTSSNIEAIDLNAKYGVTVTLIGGCAGETAIIFDHLGRPMVGDISDDAAAYVAGQLMTAPCEITLNNGENVSINIEPETGYAHIN